MHGNVLEWCEDVRHPNYYGAPVDGSSWVTGDSKEHLLRGGSWQTNSISCRSAFRYRPDPNYAKKRFSWETGQFGFRVACSIPRDS